jgi:hypothetical protein
MTIALPQCHYAPDMPMSGLRTAESLIIVTLRLRVLRWREPGRNEPDWREGLKAGNLPSWAIKAFEGLFQIVVTTTRYPLDVRGLHCSRLGFDEGRFLQLVSFFQHYRTGQAEAMLEDWLPAVACRPAADSAASLACALQRAGLLLPLRGAATAVTECEFSPIPSLIRLQ